MRNNHAVFHRTYVRAWLLALALGGVSLIASAGYAVPSSPPGFAGSPGSWTMTPPANAPTIGGGSPAANGPLFRGPAPALGGAGGAAEGVAYRVGAGGARVLAGRVVAGLIPGVGLALGIAWLASYCYERQGGSWVRTCFNEPGVPVPPISDGYRYSFTSPNVTWSNSPLEACGYRTDQLNAQFNNPSRFKVLAFVPPANCTIKDTVNGQETNIGGTRQNDVFCPVGWYITPAGCIQTPQPRPVTPEQIVEEMAPKPLPATLPGGVPYPLDPNAPFIFNPTPGTDPVAQPLRVPQGNPVPIPNTNPQQYRQPVTRFTPAPTPTEPWRMDVRPEDIVSESPTGMLQPEPVKQDSPQGKEPDKFDLCAQHPDVLACQKIDFDTPDGEIPKSTQQVTFQAENVGGGGSCPADSFVHFTSNGQTLKAWDWSATCNYFLPIRAIVMTLAAFSALLIVMPGSGRPS